MLASLNFVAISQVLKHVFVWNQLRDTLAKVLGRDIRCNAALLRQLARGQLWRVINGVSTFEIVVGEKARLEVGFNLLLKHRKDIFYNKGWDDIL